MKTLTFKNKLMNLSAVFAISLFSASLFAGEVPADARDPLESSDGYEYRGMGGWEETDAMSLSKVMIEELEYQGGDNEDIQSWDMQAWTGTDYDKYWFKFEGAVAVGQGESEIELQALSSQSVAAFWDMQYGLRLDSISGGGNSENRVFGVFGFQGLAPYWFEVDSAVFIEDDGKLSARMTASYDVLFTQRLIFQPKVSFNLSANDVPKFGVGKGLNDLQFEMRLRYEFSREVAPYIGVTWQKQYGDTASLSTANGGITEDSKLIMGVRLWF